MSIKKINNPETAIQELYFKFWQGFNEATGNRMDFKKRFKVHPYSSLRCYQDYCIGKPYHIVVAINFDRQEIRVGSYFSDTNCYDDCFAKYRETIEGKIGRSLRWKRFITKGSATLFTTACFDNQHGWENAYEVMINNMILIKDCFECC